MKTNHHYIFTHGFHAAILFGIAVAGLAQPEQNRQVTSLEPIFGQTSKELELGTKNREIPFKLLVEISPDGQHSVETTIDRKIKYRRTKDGVVERTFNACSPMVLAFSNDGGLLASAGLGSSFGKTEKITIRTWSLREPKKEGRFEIPGKMAEALAIAKGRVAVAGEMQLQCFTDCGKPAWAVAKRSPVCAIQFSKDGSAVVVSFDDGSLAVYDASTGEEREFQI